MKLEEENRTDKTRSEDNTEHDKELDRLLCLAPTQWDRTICHISV